MTRRKTSRKWLILIVLLPAIWFACDVLFVSWDAEADHVASADVIVVLGCNPVSDSGPSPCMLARAGHAADLYNKGYAQNVIATGNSLETRVLRSVLTSNGVPDFAITLESNSHDTIQNIAHTQTILQEKGWHTVVLVTEPFHINRSTLIAHDIWGSGVTVYSSPAVDSLNWSNWQVKAYNVGRDSLSLMLYQVKSLIGQRN